MRNHYVYLTFFCLVVLFGLSVGSAYARLSAEEIDARQQEWQEKADQRKTAIEERKAEREAKVEEHKENRCENATTRIENRIEKATENHEKYVDFYNNLKTRLEEHLSRLEDRGCDVILTEEELTDLDAKIAELDVEHETFISLLSDSQTYVCGESDGEFKDALQLARDQLQVVKQKASEVRSYVRTTLKETLKDQINECKLTLQDSNGSNEE